MRQSLTPMCVLQSVKILEKKDHCFQSEVLVKFSSNILTPCYLHFSCLLKKPRNSVLKQASSKLLTALGSLYSRWPEQNHKILYKRPNSRSQCMEDISGDDMKILPGHV